LKSKVYVAYLNDRQKHRSNQKKVDELFLAAGFDKLLCAGDLAAIKLHVGEAGLDTYLNPIFLRPVTDRIKAAGAHPFLTDTNTLYSGSRHNSPQHILTAAAHGFVPEVTGAPFIVADGLRGENYSRVEIGQKHFASAAIARDVLDADFMLVFSHFKGHELAGFGGALKNAAMGCAPPVGKREQHAIKMYASGKKCVGCGQCAEVCPVGASALAEGKKAKIDAAVCIGCGECMTVCPVKAITLDWSTDIGDFLERMTEYAYAALLGKRGKAAYITLAAAVTPYCDCVPWSDAPLVPDIGFLASADPVAIDQAALDLVNKQAGLTDSEYGRPIPPGEDKFLALRPAVDGRRTLAYAEELGMGSRKYELITI
jgi:uncharacterized Fe-S center protein